MSAAAFDVDLVCAQLDFFTCGMALGSLWCAPRRGFFYRSGHDTLLWPEFRIPILLLGKSCPAIPYSKSVLAFRQTRVVSALIALASCVENASDRSHRILGRWGRVGKGALGDYSHDLHREFTSFAHPCTAVTKLQANLPTESADSVRRKEIIRAQLGDSDALFAREVRPLRVAANNLVRSEAKPSALSISSPTTKVFNPPTLQQTLY